MKFDHARLVVSDLGRSLRWWEGAVGAECGSPFAVTDGPARAALVSLGNAGIQLAEAAAPAAAPFALPNDSIGAVHVCLRVRDIDQAHGRLLENGVAPSTPPRELVPGVFSLYFRDPDGIQFQLIEAGDGLGLHHVAYNVSHLDATLAWYGSALGLSPTLRSTAAGSHISEMLGTAGAAYDVALLSIGDVLLELMEWHGGTAPPERRGPDAPGAWHIALTVDHAGAMEQRAVHDTQGRRALSCYDPDGFLVHVLEPAAT